MEETKQCLWKFLGSCNELIQPSSYCNTSSFGNRVRAKQYAGTHFMPSATPLSIIYLKIANETYGLWVTNARSISILVHNFFIEWLIKKCRNLAYSSDVMDIIQTSGGDDP